MRTRIRISFFVSIVILFVVFSFIMPKEYNLFTNSNITETVKLAWFVCWVLCSLLLALLSYLATRFEGFGDNISSAIFMFIISPIALLTIGLAYFSIEIWPIQNGGG